MQVRPPHEVEGVWTHMQQRLKSRWVGRPNKSSSKHITVDMYRPRQAACLPPVCWENSIPTFLRSCLSGQAGAGRACLSASTTRAQNLEHVDLATSTARATIFCHRPCARQNNTAKKTSSEEEWPPALKHRLASRELREQPARQSGQESYAIRGKRHPAQFSS